jgi:hypothetical protein
MLFFGGTFSRLSILIMVCAFGISSLFAELLIVDTSSGLVKPLEVNSLSNQEKTRLYEIMTKYQWPSSTAYALSGQLTPAMMSLLYSPVPMAEELCIRKIVRNAGKDFDVVFVPTVLYELFVLRYVFLAESSFFANNATKIIQSFDENKISRNAQKSGNDFTDVLNTFKDSFDLTNTGWSVSTIVTAFKNHFAGAANNHVRDAYFEINEQLGFFLLQNNAYATVGDCACDVEKKSYDIAFELINSLITAYNSKDDFALPLNMYPFYFPQMVVELDTKTKLLKQDGIVAHAIDVEYNARKQNQGCFYRGTGVIQHALHKIDPQINTVIDSCLDYADFSKGSLFDESAFNPRSISYGNSLFAASLVDSGAMAYEYCAHSSCIGYALLIDKYGYVADRCNDLFFVSPLPTFVALFVGGAWFHSRSKAAVNQTPAIGFNVVGIYGTSFLKDTTNFLLTQRNPLYHEAIFSLYLADHACLIKPNVSCSSATFDRIKMNHHHVAQVAGKQHGSSISAQAFSSSAFAA